MTDVKFSDSTTLKAIQSNLGKMISTRVCNFEQRTLSTIPKMRTGRQDRAILTGLGGSGDICHLAIHFIHTQENYLILQPNHCCRYDSVAFMATDGGDRRCPPVLLVSPSLMLHA